MGRLTDSLEAQAQAVLPAPVFEYVQRGARDGRTATEAAAAWERFRFLPQVLRDVSHVDRSTTLLGTPVATPLAVAPTTLQRAAHVDGEVAMADAVVRAGSLMVVSSNAGSTFQDIGATGVSWWLQLYVSAHRPTCRPLVERAVAAGARAVVLTVDTPVVGTKYTHGDTIWDIAEPGWLRVNFEPDYGDRVGDEKARDLAPRDIDWLATASGLPVVVKGVMRADDARRCVGAGATAVWVSNHGGRQLDLTAATADALGAVVEAVGAQTEVYVDGGIRNAGHALTALALGARAVFLGRLPLYALAVGGPAGVAAMFEELDSDLVELLALAGCADLTALPRDLVYRGGSPA